MSGSEGESPDLSKDEVAAAETSVKGDATEAMEARQLTEEELAESRANGNEGTESHRALDAFDSLPADSEASVDYGGARTVESHVGYTEETQAWGSAQSAPLMGVGYEPVPELSVELVVTTPDGRRFQFAEGLEFPDDPDLVTDAQVAAMVGEVAGSAMHRFEGSTRRAALGL